MDTEFPKEDRQTLQNILLRINEIATGTPAPGEVEFYKHELFNRMFRHFFTGTHIKDGPELEIAGKKGRIKDFSAIVIILRSVIETLTMFFYIYVDDPSEEEIEFRYWCWKRHGMKTRVRFNFVTEQQEKKQDEETEELRKIEARLLKSQKLLRYTKPELRKFNDFGQWIFESEADLLVRIGYSREGCQNMYQYLSSHAHVESMGLMQVWQMDLDGRTPEFVAIIETNIILATFAFVSLYLSVKPEIAMKIDGEMREKIEFWKNSLKEMVLFG